MTNVAELARAAGQLANSGRWQDAERIWQEVHRLDPRHPGALFSLGVHAIQRSEFQKAYELLTAAREVAPQDKLVLLTLGRLNGQRGDAAAEREAIEATLALDAYYLPGLLARADWIERHEGLKAAVPIYANALRISPPAESLPPELRSSLDYAGKVVAVHSAQLSEFLTERIAGPLANLPAEERGRWREAGSIMAGFTKPYVSDSNQLYVPRLPAIPFFERKLFPWLAGLEAQTAAICEEIKSIVAEDNAPLTPYISYRPGDPVNQWQELNHSPRWSALHLWRGGSPVIENLERCPVTAGALQALPMADIAGLCPNAMFSVLAPRTRIPPHHGETNARVIVHLPLVVPDRCRYRVGFERREWKVGECLVFDDTLEHEAINDSDELRIVLIFDAWNPLLSPVERELVGVLAAAAREFSSL